MLFFGSLFAVFVSSAFAQLHDLSLTSPDGELTMQFAIRAAKGTPASAATEGKLVYSVTFRKKPVVEDSSLGLELEGAPVLGSNVHIASSEAGKGVDDYTLTT